MQITGLPRTASNPREARRARRLFSCRCARCPPRTRTRTLSPLDAGSPARTLSRCKRQRRSRRTTARPASCTAASTSTTARCTRGSPRRRRTAPMQGRRRARRRRSRTARRRSRLHEGGLPSEARTSARCGWGRVVRGGLRVQCMRGGWWRSRAASVMNSRCVCRGALRLESSLVILSRDVPCASVFPFQTNIVQAGTFLPCTL